MTSAHNSTNSLVFSTYDHHGTAYGHGKTKPAVSFHVGTGESSDQATCCAEDIGMTSAGAGTGRRCPCSLEQSPHNKNVTAYGDRFAKSSVGLDVRAREGCDRGAGCCERYR